MLRRGAANGYEKSNSLPVLIWHFWVHVLRKINLFWLSALIRKYKQLVLALGCNNVPTPSKFNDVSIIMLFASYLNLFYFIKEGWHLKNNKQYSVCVCEYSYSFNCLRSNRGKESCGKSNRWWSSFGRRAISSVGWVSAIPVFLDKDDKA